MLTPTKRTHSLLLAAATTIMGREPARALEVRGDFQAGYRLSFAIGRAPQQPWTSHSLRIKQTQCIALGRGAFATPYHVGAPQGARDLYRVVNTNGVPIDLMLFRYDAPAHAVPDLPIAARNSPKAEPVVLATARERGFAVYDPQIKWLPLNETAWRAQPSIGVGITPKPLIGKVTKVQHGDSGAAVWAYQPERDCWALAGILIEWTSESAALPALPPFGRAIDTTLNTGVGRQLIDYRNGSISGGSVTMHARQYLRHHKKEAKIALAATSSAGALGTAAWLACRRKHKGKT